MIIDAWILAFSAATVIVTIWMGFWTAKRSSTAHDFFVAGRSVSVGWNASAISGEYLSAASFMGVAGMVMSSGYDALWYPVCYACEYSIRNPHRTSGCACSSCARCCAAVARSCLVSSSRSSRSTSMKMLGLHAPEKLGLKQEYIQEHKTR